MKRYVSIAVTILFVILWATFQFTSRSAAQTEPSQPAQVQLPQAGPGNGSAQQPALDCKGCHGAGKTLPYLGGENFHKEAHAAYDHGFHAKGIKNGQKAATCMDCHSHNGDMSTILPASDPNSTISRANLALTCGKCHGDPSVMQGTSISNRPFLSYQESVHGKAISRGNLAAAVCTDCHSNHDIVPASDSQSPIFKSNIPATCGKCHSGISTEFNESVHGQAVSRGVSRAPVCTDCHGIHSIKLPTEPGTSTPTQAMATGTCAQCHEGVTLTQEFGVQGQRVSSYKDSYHGMASGLGSKVVANCASCHGVHNIRPSSDPKSMISANNLPQTCGQCHPGATQAFTQGKVHLNTPASQDMGTIGSRWVRYIYLPLIYLVIGGMVFHNLLVWRKKAIAKRRHGHRNIVRLTLNQRVQHWLLLTSFITLVISGFALQYPDWGFSWLMGSSEAIRRIVHRAAAVVMILVGVYHLGYLALTKEGRKWVKDMLPKIKDAKDVLQNFGYYLGLKVGKPKIERFGYAEKAEYWAVVWGTFIMGLTGLMIWFKISVFGFLPRWWVDIALSIHFYEAVLATLAIIVWHFYHVIFDPDAYPINWAFYDGRVEDEHYREEHELDYERLMKEKEERKAEEQETGSDAAKPEPETGD